MPKQGNLRKLILEEAHSLKYTMHPGKNKMCHNLKEDFWWIGMKKDIRDYISKCLTCSQTKAAHQQPTD